jgi:hypothetical protein
MIRKSRLLIPLYIDYSSPLYLEYTVALERHWETIFYGEI